MIPFKFYFDYQKMKGGRGKKKQKGGEGERGVQFVSALSRRLPLHPLPPASESDHWDPVAFRRIPAVYLQRVSTAAKCLSFSALLRRLPLFSPPSTAMATATVPIRPFTVGHVSALTRQGTTPIQRLLRSSRLQQRLSDPVSHRAPRPQLPAAAAVPASVVNSVAAQLRLA